MLRFHAPSEHTIDGTAYDMEISIQTIKAMNVGTSNYAVLGVLFSVDSSTAFFCTEKCIASIDAFFDSLELEKDSPTVTKLAFDAFMYFDTNNRFAYMGSNSMPPCHPNWYRTVCMTIYPIKQKHLDLFKASV
jgi:carbonic anhydrase